VLITEFSLQVGTGGEGSVSGSPTSSAGPNAGSGTTPASSTSVADYKSLTDPAIAALLDAARPLGAEVSVKEAKWPCIPHTGIHAVLIFVKRQMCGGYVQILKASEIVEKAFLVSQRLLLACCILRLVVNVLRMSKNVYIYDGHCMGLT
jgi:hypothetical protein